MQAGKLGVTIFVSLLIYFCFMRTYYLILFDRLMAVDKVWKMCLHKPLDHLIQKENFLLLVKYCFIIVLSGYMITCSSIIYMFGCVCVYVVEGELVLQWAKEVMWTFRVREREWPQGPGLKPDSCPLLFSLARARADRWSVKWICYCLVWFGSIWKKTPDYSPRCHRTHYRSVWNLLWSAFLFLFHSACLRLLNIQ